MIQLTDVTSTGRAQVRPTPELDRQLVALGFTELGLLRAEPKRGQGTSVVVAVWASPRGDALAIPEQDPRDPDHRLLYLRTLCADGSLVDTSDERARAPGYPAIRGRIRESARGAKWVANHRPGAPVDVLWSVHQAAVAARGSAPAVMDGMDAVLTLSRHGDRLAHRTVMAGQGLAWALIFVALAAASELVKPMPDLLLIGLLAAAALSFPFVLKAAMGIVRRMPRLFWPKAPFA